MAEGDMWSKEETILNLNLIHGFGFYNAVFYGI